MAFLSIIFGFLLFGVCLLLFRALHDRAKSKVRNDRQVDSAHPIRIDVAAISRDLVPLIDKHALSSATINMVGSDGAYFDSPNGKFFTNAVLRWTEAGATMNYIVIDPSPKALECMDELTLATKGKFIVHEVSNEACDECVSAIVDEFMTLHPTLIEQADHSKSMWVEYNHPVGTRFAYDVKFTSSNAMNSAELAEFEHYNAMIRSLKDACTKREVNFGSDQKTAA